MRAVGIFDALHDHIGNVRYLSYLAVLKIAIILSLRWPAERFPAGTQWGYQELLENLSLPLLFLCGVHLFKLWFCKITIKLVYYFITYIFNFRMSLL